MEGVGEFDGVTKQEILPFDYEDDGEGEEGEEEEYAEEEEEYYEEEPGVCLCVRECVCRQGWL